MTAVTSPPFLLTPEEIRSFDEQGFLVLRDRIPRPLLERCVTGSRTWIEDGLRAGPGDGPGGGPDGDWRWSGEGEEKRLFRVDYLHDKGSPASLELLGSPQVLGIAQSLAGPDFVPAYESLVFKDDGDGKAVHWHQDAVHPRRHRVFNVGVYLDDSLSGEGALRVLPGSQLGAADICALEESSGWEPPGVREVALSAGDVLVHDTMVVHGSPAVRGNRLRRTLYLEFRPARQILQEGPWDRSWIDARMRLLPLALDAHARAFPGAPAFDWAPPAGLRPEPAADRAEELRVAHRVHTPGTHCSAGPAPF